MIELRKQICDNMARLIEYPKDSHHISLWQRRDEYLLDEHAQIERECNTILHECHQRRDRRIALSKELAELHVIHKQEIDLDFKLQKYQKMAEEFKDEKDVVSTANGMITQLQNQIVSVSLRQNKIDKKKQECDKYIEECKIWSKENHERLKRHKERNIKILIEYKITIPGFTDVNRKEMKNDVFIDTIIDEINLDIIKSKVPPPPSLMKLVKPLVSSSPPVKPLSSVVKPLSSVVKPLSSVVKPMLSPVKPLSLVKPSVKPLSSSKPSTIPPLLKKRVL